MRRNVRKFTACVMLGTILITTSNPPSRTFLAEEIGTTTESSESVVEVTEEATEEITSEASTDLSEEESVTAEKSIEKPTTEIKYSSEAIVEDTSREEDGNIAETPEVKTEVVKKELKKDAKLSSIDVSSVKVKYSYNSYLGVDSEGSSILYYINYPNKKATISVEYSLNGNNKPSVFIDGVECISSSDKEAVFEVKSLEGKDLSYVTIDGANISLNGALGSSVCNDMSVTNFSEVVEGDISSSYSNVYTKVSSVKFNVEKPLGIPVTKDNLKVTVNGVSISDFSVDEKANSAGNYIISVNGNTFNESTKYDIQVSIFPGCGAYTKATSCSFYTLLPNTDISLSTDISGEKGIYNNSLYINKDNTLVVKGSDHPALRDFSVYKYADSNDASSISKVTESTSSMDGTKYYTLTDGRYYIGIDESGDFLSILTGKRFTSSEQYTDVVVDNEKPSLLASICLDNKWVGLSDINSDVWYTSLSDILRANLIDDTGISNVIIDVNGTECLNTGFIKAIEGTGIAKECKFSKNSTTGEYILSVKALDSIGNESNSLSCTFKVDEDDPMLSQVRLVGDYTSSDNTTYINDKTELSFKASDITSGVDRVVLSYTDKDGEVITERLTNQSGTYTYTMRSGKDYQIQVVDKAGRSIKKELSQLIPDLCSTILVDSSNPIITPLIPTPDYSANNKKWYKKPFIFTVGFEDDLMIKGSYIKANDTLLSTSDNAFIPKVNLEGDLSKVYSEGKYAYSIEMYAEDILGKETVQNDILYIDTIAPTNVKGVLSKEGNLVEDVLFFDSQVSLNVTADDGEGSQINEYALFDGTDLQLSNDGVFTINGGTYRIEVTDNVNNTTRLNLKDFVEGVSVDSIVVDSELPEVTASREGGVNNWYNSDVIYNSKAVDNEGIHSINVVVNNKEVYNYISEKADEKDKEFTFDTSKATSLEDGSYNVEITVTDNAGNSNQWSDTVFIDRESPTIDKFVFSGEGFQDGTLDGSTGDYGFYFKKEADCEVYVSDGTVSSGLGSVEVRLTPSSGKNVKVMTLPIEGGVSTFTIEKNFKGTISVVAYDNVTNASKEIKPDGVITEDSNTAVNNIDIDIELPKTSYKDAQGLNLYSGNVKINSTISSPTSGVREIKWGIGEETKGTAKIDNKGNVVEGNISVLEKDKNLVIKLSEVLSISNNENNCEVWVSATDRAGYVSKSSKRFSVDKDKPVIKVSYNKNSNSSYYNTTRIATISISERNFDSKNVKISGNKGTLSGWKHNGNMWTSTMSFSKDGDYKISVNCTDMAGNVSSSYKGNKFTIDKTKPEVNVSWSNDNVVNGKYYAQPRTATITVKEHNFSASSINIEGGSVSGWSNSGDMHTASVSYSSNGVYKLSVSGRDSAGNELNSYSSEEFIIDIDTPTITIDGVQDGISYKDDVYAKISVSDEYIDTSNSSVSIEGKRNGKLQLSGGLSMSGGVLTLDNLPKEEKYDDVYTVKVQIKDMSGNSDEAELMFSVNRFGSAYEFMTTDILGNYINSRKDIEIQEYNVDKVNLDESIVSVLLNGDKIEVSDSAISMKSLGEKDGKNVYSYKVSEGVFSEDGKYLIQVYSANIDGTKYDSASEEYAFVLDTTKPDVIISGIESKSVYNEYEKKATVDIRDLTGIDVISILLNGKEVEYSEKDGIYSILIPEGSDSQDLSVTVVDRAGNESVKTIENFIITSSKMVYLSHQWWFVLSIVLTLVAVIVLTILIIYKKRKVNV